MKFGTAAQTWHGGHRAEVRGHHVRRKRYVVEVREVGDPLSFTEAAGLLEVGHDDVHRAHLQQPPESVREVNVLAGTDWRAGLLRR